MMIFAARATTSDSARRFCRVNMSHRNGNIAMLSASGMTAIGASPTFFAYLIAPNSPLASRCVA